MKRMIISALAGAIVAALFGCATLEVAFTPSGSRSSGSGEPMVISGLSNNSEKALDAGTYRGLTITHNSVTLTGTGTGSTFISGNVTIRGNSCTIRGLTIQGDVFIEGNNADLAGARITGKVVSSGNNNRW